MIKVCIAFLAVVILVLYGRVIEASSDHWYGGMILLAFACGGAVGMLICFDVLGRRRG